MKSVRKLKQPLFVALAALVLATTGCREEASHTEDHERAETAKPCGFKEGHGVFVGEETRKAIGLAVVEVQPKTIPLMVRATARVFSPGKASMTMECDVAGRLKPGTRATLGGQHPAEVLAVNCANEPLGGADEVLVGFQADGLAPGAHVAATVELPAGEPLQAVPESSVLTTATGDFVFAVNGEHFLRTPIKTAGRANGWVAVTDGLLEGDAVATSGVQELWRIELHATKAGAACAH